jgi:hypothetical protein
LSYVGFWHKADVRLAAPEGPLLYRGFGQALSFWLRHATFLLHVVVHWLMLPHGALASLRGWRVTTS